MRPDTYSEPRDIAAAPEPGAGDDAASPFIPPVLTTARLRLVSPLEVDLSELVRSINDAEIARNTLTIPHPYREADGHEWFEHLRRHQIERDAAQFTLTMRESSGADARGGAIVGGAGLSINSKHCNAELGYWIARPFWGRGYATEAARAVIDYGFDGLHLHRIHAHHFTRNPASGRVLVKAGMRHEGTMRGHVLKDGEYIDIETYGILSTDRSGV